MIDSSMEKKRFVWFHMRFMQHIKNNVGMAHRKRISDIKSKSRVALIAVLWPIIDLKKA